MVTTITDWHDLDDVRNDLTEDYVLGNHLDAETSGYSGIGDSFEPIGQSFSDPFDGTFDGDGYLISDLVVDPISSGTGLFGYCDGVVENLGISNLFIDDDNNTFNRYGGIAARGDATISKCGVVGEIIAGDFGGLVIGDAASDVDVSDCYAIGEISATDSDISALGGFCGRDSGGLFERCYAAVVVNESGDNVGGFTGTADGTQTDCYWDTERSGQSTTGGGAVGLTSDEMRGEDAETNLSGFDFTNVWDAVE